MSLLSFIYTNLYCTKKLHESDIVCIHRILWAIGKRYELFQYNLFTFIKKTATPLQARIIHVTLDGRQVSPSDGYLVRKGSGNCYFDFAQEISFTQPQYQPTVAPSTPGTLGCLQQSLAVRSVNYSLNMLLFNDRICYFLA